MIVLVAASGLAREVIATLRLKGAPDPVGVLDDDPALWGTSLDGVPVLGTLDLLVDRPDWRPLLCAGQGRVRGLLRDRLTALGVDSSRYATVVHPHVVVPPGCTLGAGSILLGGVVMTAGVQVGEHVVVMPHVSLTHDVVVDDLATLCAGVALAGLVHVGSTAYLGTHSSVRERVRVGPGATLGMGAVLLQDLPADETWVGVPARPMIRVTRPNRANPLSRTAQEVS